METAMNYLPTTEGGFITVSTFICTKLKWIIPRKWKGDCVFVSGSDKKNTIVLDSGKHQWSGENGRRRKDKS